MENKKDSPKRKSYFTLNRNYQGLSKLSKKYFYSENKIKITLQNTKNILFFNGKLTGLSKTTQKITFILNGKQKLRTLQTTQTNTCSFTSNRTFFVT